MQFRLESADLRPAIVADDVQDLELTGFKAEGHPQAEALIRLENTQRVFITGSRPLNGIGNFVCVEGAASRDVVLAANDLSRARSQKPSQQP